MIGISPSFVRVMSYVDLVQNAGNYFMYIFTGVQPTPAEIQAIKDMDATSGELKIDNVLNWAQGRGDTVLHARVLDDFDPVFPNNRLIQFPLADKTEEIYQLNAGAVGWFMFGKSNNTTTISSFNITNIANPAERTHRLLYTLFGTAGDEESEADLGILTGNVDTDREYTMTDLEVAFI